VCMQLWALLHERHARGQGMEQSALQVQVDSRALLKVGCTVQAAAGWAGTSKCAAPLQHTPRGTHRTSYHPRSQKCLTLLYRLLPGGSIKKTCTSGRRCFR